MDIRWFSRRYCAVFINGDMIPNLLPNQSTFLPNSFRSIKEFLDIIDILKNNQLFAMEKEERFNFLTKTVHYENTNLSEEESFSYWKYCFTDYIDLPSENDMVWYGLVCF